MIYKNSDRTNCEEDLDSFLLMFDTYAFQKSPQVRLHSLLCIAICYVDLQGLLIELMNFNICSFQLDPQIVGTDPGQMLADHATQENTQVVWINILILH